MKYKLLLLLICLPLFITKAHANNPGGHMVQLTWQDTCPTCTFNIYRGSVTGVCGLGKVPYASNIVTLAYEDDTVVAGQTYVYAVTAISATGGESNCSTELQLSVSSTQAPTPTVPSGQSH